jgi:hypothetical protein
LGAQFLNTGRYVERLKKVQVMEEKG